MNHSNNKAWRQYEAGKAYKRRIGLYEAIRQNERFYRGDQWQSGEGQGLPHPVFNVIRRVIDYLISSVASARLSIRFTNASLPYVEAGEQSQRLQQGLQTLEAHTAYRWKENAMEQKLMRLLTDAALTGDGVLYCYWDPSIKSPQLFEGDIVTDVIDNVNLFVSDVNRPDIQSQDYIILAGRASVASLRAEAEAAGVSEEEALDHVFGYTCGNDLSCRDAQMRSGQWLIGKTMPGFGPCGPVIVTADEFDVRALYSLSSANS